MQQILFFLCFLCCSLLSMAQTTVGIIRGQVSDGYAPIVGASIKVLQTGQSVFSDKNGNYSLSLPEGKYDLNCSHNDFANKILNNIIVIANTSLVQNISLNKADRLMESELNKDISTIPVMVEDFYGDGFDISSSAKEIASPKRATPTTSAIRTTASPLASPPPPPRTVTAPTTPTRTSSEHHPSSGLHEAPPVTTDVRLKYGSKKESEPSVVAAQTTNILPKAGQLTAGEVNDFAKWKLWNDIDQTDLASYQQLWKIRPLDRYTVQLRTKENGTAIVDAAVLLIDNASGHSVWEARTDNTGKAELWANLYDNATDAKKGYRIEVQYQDQKHHIKTATPFHKGINHLSIPTACNPSTQVDIALVIDLTSSMGDELQYLQSEWSDVMERLQKDHQDLSLRSSFLGYRDHGDDFVTRYKDFGTNFPEIIQYLKEQKAAGGGDVPEAVDQALHLAVDSLSWSSNARAKLLFLVLDAPPHLLADDQIRWQKAVEAAAKKGIRIIPLACSGIKKDFEYLMRATALATGGTYTFLTNHSGIGNPHIEPTTDQYKVEHLNDMLVRIAKQFIQMEPCLPEPIVAAEQPQNVDISIPSLANVSNSTDSSHTQINTTNFIRCYPNPTAGQVRIEVSTDINEVFLADINGRLLERYDMENNKNLSIDIGQYPAGMYLFTYFIGEKAYTGKILLFH